MFWRLDPILGPVEVDKISELDDFEDRVIVRTEVGTVTVSTVFLVIDHNFGEGEPILFETMVFGGPLDEKQERYCTHEGAMQGHRKWVIRVKKSRTVFQKFFNFLEGRGYE